MDESNRLSLLALIVAVVALVVSAWQLAQQLFATATDGMRYCQGSVMGIWARKSRLSWRWNQIRFETKYTTPDITLSSLADEELLRKGPTVPLHPGAVRRRPWIYRIPVVKTLTEIFMGPASDFEGFFDICAANGDEPWELRQTRIPNLSITTRTLTEKLSLLVFQLRSASYTEDSPDLVTWPVLLRSIYANQLQATVVIPSEPSVKVSDIGLEDGVDRERSYQSITEAEPEDRVVIRLVERSWDLVPPDVVRPLAKSTVGTMLVISHRLGMQWYDFRPNEGLMKGVGYGHEINSETIRGLGLVLQYTFHEESRRIKTPDAVRTLIAEGEHFAPTQSGDKLHCSIVPIDRKATHLKRSTMLKDMQLVNSASQVDLETFYNALGLQRQVCKDIDESLNADNSKGGGGPGKHFRFAIEDAIAMLCPLVPKPNSHARYVMWPLRNKFQPFTPLRQYPGVRQLKDRLGDNLRTNVNLRHLMEQRTDTLLEQMTRSPLEYLNEICDAVEANRSSTKKSRIDNMYLSASDDRLARIFSIHRETSEVFKTVEARIGIPTNNGPDEQSVRPVLVDLVGAHVTMAIRHGALANNSVKSATDDEDDSFAARRMRVVTQLASLFADDIESGKGRAVGKNIRHRGYTKDQLAPVEVTALWWVLVLRGICWWMTVQLKLPESQIQSYWYYSQTPVYIT